MVFVARSSWLRKSEICLAWASTSAWFVRSPLLSTVSSRVFFSSILFHLPTTVFLSFPSVSGSIRRSPFPICDHCPCCGNRSSIPWCLCGPFCPLAAEVVWGPSPLLGLLPSLIASRGRGPHLVVSISWWIVCTSLTLISRLEASDIRRRGSPSNSWRHVVPPVLVSPSNLG